MSIYLFGQCHQVYHSLDLVVNVLKTVNSWGWRPRPSLDRRLLDWMRNECIGKLVAGYHMSNYMHPVHALVVIRFIPQHYLLLGASVKGT